ANVTCCDVDLPVFVGIPVPNYLVGCDSEVFRNRFGFSRSTCLSRGDDALQNQTLSGDAPYYEPWSRDCDNINPGEAVNLYNDRDGDGYPDSEGYPDSDCNDNSAAIHPGAVELCDGIDNDCDGTVDENIAAITWYRDYDMDGYGNPNNTTQSCLPLDQPSSSNNYQPRWSANNDDCADSRANVHPGAPEICDGLDNDCDGDRDEESDADGDGFTACASDYSYQDCNDANPAVFPGMIEITCNGLDDDCDASTPDNTDCPVETDAPGYSGPDSFPGDDDTDVVPPSPVTSDVDGPGYPGWEGDAEDENTAVVPNVDDGSSPESPDMPDTPVDTTVPSSEEGSPLDTAETFPADEEAKPESASFQLFGWGCSLSPERDSTAVNLLFLWGLFLLPGFLLSARRFLIIKK
ncbi:MAG: putative metal-binding motif-containing protein, partial [Deltaproteobacteria bacterium]|nr:putative metal-binding motif-containing protein [Deltaproteobacteria bacterium]